MTIAAVLLGAWIGVSVPVAFVLGRIFGARRRELESLLPGGMLVGDEGEDADTAQHYGATRSEMC